MIVSDWEKFPLICKAISELVKPEVAQFKLDESGNIIKWFRSDIQQPSKEEIENKVKEIKLNQVKEQKINEINRIAEKKIVSGFTSSALGTPHLYQSEPIDQLNLLGVVQTAQLTNENQLFKCSPDNGKTWEYKEHTPEQLVQVLKTGKETKISILLKANELKEKVKHATSVEEIQQITWEDNNE